MPTVRTRDLPPMTVATDNASSEVFIPATQFEPADGITGVKAWGEVRGLTGNIKLRPGVQLANDVRNPDTLIGIGAQVSANGIIDPSAASVSSGSKGQIRAGWLVQLASAGSLSTAAVIGKVSFER